MPHHQKKIWKVLRRRIVAISATVALSLVIIGLVSYFIINSYRNNNWSFGKVLLDYVQQLQGNGLLLAGEVKPKAGGDAFIAILAPKGGGITDAQIHEYIELITYTSGLLEKRQGFRTADLSLSFNRPRHQEIIFVNLPGGMPAPVGLVGEATINAAQDPSAVISVVNLSGNLKQLGRPYSNYWATIQAVCLGYSILANPNSDSICNIFSSNAAAGYAGIDPATATTWINGLGSTQLAYLGGKEYKYRFLSFVYQDFIQK